MTQYIPYSIRNNITDKDLAGLLDYLEREMGWDIHFEGIDPSQEYAITCRPNTCMRIESWHTPYLGIMTVAGGGMQVVNRITIEKEIFFRTYKSILPVIRDLYSKK